MSITSASECAISTALNFYHVLGLICCGGPKAKTVAIVQNENGVELNLIFNANAGETGRNVLMDVPGKYLGYTNMALPSG